MGIYDRDYVREEQPGLNLGGPRTIVTTIILVNVAVYLLQLLTRAPDGGQFTNLLSLHGDLFRKPWLFFELLTYGFLHDPRSIGHILFNMLGLWFLGREVEFYYGRREFLWLYLTAILFSGFTWVLVETATGQASNLNTMLGASGGVVAVILLFILNFPRRMLLLWFVIPIPAWVVGVLIIAYNLFGATGASDSNVAFTAHLGGALYAYIFFRTRWSLVRFVPAGGVKRWFRSGPKLRVHTPDDREETDSRRVDEILRKIKQQGQESLTRQERRILEEASRRYQQRQR